MSSTAAVIHWFRQDLRLFDNPALAAAAADGRPVVPVYVLDDASPGSWRLGAASRWWLHHSLQALQDALAKQGSRLVLRRGPADEMIAAVAKEVGARLIVTSRQYEPWAASLEQRLLSRLAEQGATLRRYAGRLLAEPESIGTEAGAPYRVFTPFWRTLQAKCEPAAPIPAPASLRAPHRWPASDKLASWRLRPTQPDWARAFKPVWQPGHVGAARRLCDFLDDAASQYALLRDRPDVAATSRLSPHLHFGEISPRQCWHAARTIAAARPEARSGVSAFLRELGWREFSAHLLHHFPSLPERPFRAEFATFPWHSDQKLLAAWQQGRTGYPLVDAGMRQLWATGWMHNRVRMVTASFLVKHLLIPWTHGQAWFWDTLVDADLANNSASWQWVAGCGADAAPYFRIFNPVKQGMTFDPDGNYVRKWVSELQHVAGAHIHAPWLAPADVLTSAGVSLGTTYPKPVVDHAEARARALRAFDQIKAVSA